MMRKIAPLLFLLLLSSTLLSQDIKRGVILINGVAHVADLSNTGSVIAFYQSIPNYFNTDLSDSQIIARVEQQGLNSEGKVDLYTNSEDEPKLMDFKRVKEYSVDQKQYISFSRGRAILNKKAVDQIRALADSFQNQEINEIIINAYHDDTSRQRLLAENRSMAIKDLLVTFGVNEFQIQRNLPYGNEGDQLYFVYLRTVK